VTRKAAAIAASLKERGRWRVEFMSARRGIRTGGGVGRPLPIRWLSAYGAGGIRLPGVGS
jgi:hypothetical protein